ncbi:energy transducer TonB [Parafilimonas sp.]|uniref:energy transducer TonB n=1 Tax=Parafilimonas sp. TaxID=1969739 RepID=UPI003F820923
MFIKRKPLLLFIISLLYCCTALSQEKKDTIYFDQNWSICEKPVAEYYRVCTLNKEKSIFYKGDVEDYFINGKLEMKGHYSNDGKKNGAFIFYNKNGELVKNGLYKDNEMKGDWLYYDNLGRMVVHYICNSSTDFTPELIINNNGDTLLKDGNGRFSFDVQKDLPNIFPVSATYIVEGEVKNHMKNGTFKYSSFTSTKYEAVYTEIFKDGRFIRANERNMVLNYHVLNKPLTLLNLTDRNLDKVDKFYHLSIVFGFDRNSDDKLINFLLNNETPFIQFKAQQPSDNDKAFFYIIKNVILNSSFKQFYIGNMLAPLNNNTAQIYLHRVFLNSKETVFPKIEGDIVLTVDTFGYVIHAAFSSGLPKKEVNYMHYYFSRLADLAPYEDRGEKVMKNVAFKLAMLIDTLKSDSIRVNYVVYKADSIKANELRNYLAEQMLDTEVQILAKFPGGNNAWLRYLERNLNVRVAKQHGVPNGHYTVTISFLVNADGSISDVHAENDPGYGTAEEAVRVMKRMPRWIPAIRDGKNVKYRQKQNIVFVVSGG